MNIVKDLTVTSVSASTLNCNNATVIGDLTVKGNAIVNKDFFKQFNYLQPTEDVTLTAEQVVSGMILFEVGEISSNITLTLPTVEDVAKLFPPNTLLKYTTFVVINRNTGFSITLQSPTGGGTWNISEPLIPNDTTSLYELYLTNINPGNFSANLLEISNSSVT